MTSLLHYLFTTPDHVSPSPRKAKLVLLDDKDEPSEDLCKVVLDDSETENPSLSSDSSTCGIKRVSFAATISKVISNDSYLTPEEKSATFYNGADQRRFEKSRVLAIKQYLSVTRKGLKWDESRGTLRGLEDWFQAKSKQSVRREHSQRVMDEVRRQKIAGEHDEGRIAAVSLEGSKASLQRATIMGKADQEAILDNPSPFLQLVEI